MGKAARVRKAAAAARKALATAEKASQTAALPESSTAPPPRPPPQKPARPEPPASLPHDIVRISQTPLQRYAFFTPSSPLICSLIQPGGIKSSLGPGVAQCERILGYTFKSKALLAEALKVDQAVDPQAQFRLKGALFYLPYNKRLAIYGDSLLRTYLARQWLELGPVEGTGPLWYLPTPPYFLPVQITVDPSSSSSRTAKTNLALSDQYLGSVYRKLGLASCVSSDGNVTATSALSPNREKNPKYMATTVEAIAAAAFLDGGNPALEIAMECFGMNKLFAECPVIYDFFRHGQPEGAPSPAPGVPSVDLRNDKTPS
ncbi:hypothetical protein PG993_000154 [Apiospora rasikravindrae]|uniref:RNase III domain-containing protein n=1 Tax=Apiospora rasikravindrae TaxID=990691 RepID=A0ABR1U7Q0_9PEZI